LRLSPLSQVTELPATVGVVFVKGAACLSWPLHESVMTVDLTMSQLTNYCFLTRCGKLIERVVQIGL